MTDYLRLDVPKFETGDDPFEYLRTVKMITDELGASESRAIQMAGVTLKCEKAREWFNQYVNPRVESLSWEQFATEFAEGAFPDSARKRFHDIVDMAQKREASAKLAGTSDVNLSPLHEAGIERKKGGRGLRRSKKNKFWKQIKSGLGIGEGSSSGLNNSKCPRCGRPHKGVCLVGTTACFRCGQEGHIARECSTATLITQSQQTASDRVTQPGALALALGRGRGSEITPSSTGSPGEGPSVPARIFALTQQEADTSDRAVTGTFHFRLFCCVYS